MRQIDAYVVAFGAPINASTGYPMESTKVGGGCVFFMQRMLRNKFLFLTVVLAVCVSAYIVIGLVKLLGS